MAITADAECGLRAWKMRDNTQTFVASLDLVSSGKDDEVRPSALSVEVNQSTLDKLNIVVGFKSGQVGLYSFNILKQDFETRQVFSCFMDQAVTSLAQSVQGYLLAMSKTKAISLYRIEWTETDEDTSTPIPVFSLRSQSIWRPVSVNLRVNSNILIASILYAYPRLLFGWSVGIQELQWDLKTHKLLPSRHATSQQDGPSSTKIAARVEYLPPTLSKPTSLCYNHPYLLATHPDNTLSLYMVKSTKSELSISSGMRLWGHTSDVYAANIGSRGKAVTVAHGDDVRVWQLEEGLTSALARKATPGPLISVKLQPISAKEDEDAIINQDSLLRLEAAEDRHEDELLPASIDFDEERLVVLKNRGLQSQALFIYDFT